MEKTIERKTKKDIETIVYDYVKQIDNNWENWEECHKFYEQGMAKLKAAYDNNEINYTTYEHLQDVLAHQN